MPCCSPWPTRGGSQPVRLARLVVGLWRQPGALRESWAGFVAARARPPEQPRCLSGSPGPPAGRGGGPRGSAARGRLPGACGSQGSAPPAAPAGPQRCQGLTSVGRGSAGSTVRLRCTDLRNPRASPRYACSAEREAEVGGVGSGWRTGPGPREPARPGSQAWVEAPEAEVLCAPQCPGRECRASLSKPRRGRQQPAAAGRRRRHRRRRRAPCTTSALLTARPRPADTRRSPPGGRPRWRWGQPSGTRTSTWPSRQIQAARLWRRGDRSTEIPARCLIARPDAWATARTRRSHKHVLRARVLLANPGPGTSATGRSRT